MTTQNLNGIDDVVTRQATMVAQWRQRAADLLRDREQLTADTAIAKANAEMIARGIQQHFADKAVPLDEEIGQVVAIVGGPSAPAPTPAPAVVTPVPAPAPVTPVVAPMAPAVRTAITPPTVPVPLVNTPAPVAYVRWVRGWRLLEWVLALLLAFIAFKISGDYQDFGFRTGFWSTVQHAFWRTGWTLIGFTVGGLVGTYFVRPFEQTFVATYRATNPAPTAPPAAPPAPAAAPVQQPVNVP